MQVVAIKQQAEGRRRRAGQKQHLADPYRKAQRELTKALGKRQARKLALAARRKPDASS